MQHKSFLKWAGGKSQLVDKIISLMPLNRRKRYLEPFVGSGVVALNVPDDFQEIIISDTNSDLIGIWDNLKNHRNTFISTCRGYFNSCYNNEEWYYKFRKLFNESKHDHIRTSLFLYLNRHCFNGLCRFNSKGEFNVPFGRYKTIYFPEKELRHAAEVSKKMKIFCNDFQSIMRMAQPGDVFYLDPPYIPISKTSGFTTYSTNGFTADEHIILVQNAELAQQKGATVIISNNDVPVARKLYADATEIHFVPVRKSIGAAAGTRKKLQEIIAVYRP
jgi:DNA adenine methylase